MKYSDFIVISDLVPILVVIMNSQIRYGIDLGGTKIEGIVLDDANIVLARERLPTESHQGYEHIIGQIGQVIKKLESATGSPCIQVGIGTPGTMDPQTGLLKNSNTVCLNDKPFDKDLSQTLQKEVQLANDANCFALAEVMAGSVKALGIKTEVVFGIIMGTGVGGGLVVNNKLIGGLQGIAGEWGHNHLDDSGGPCYCGKTGCVEKVLSGPSLEAYYHNLSGEKLSLQEIVARARSNSNPYARQTLDRLLDMFGKAVSVLINILDPDVIVIGGGVGNIEELYTEGPQRIKKYIFNNRVDTKLIKPLLGDSAGVYGAAYLF